MRLLLLIVSLIPALSSAGVFTAYCTCKKCTHGSGRTASGVPAKGYILAADRHIRFGTLVKIGAETYVVADRGSAINGHHFDVLMTSHNKATRFGRKRLEYKLIVPTPELASRGGQYSLAYQLWTKSTTLKRHRQSKRLKTTKT